MPIEDISAEDLDGDPARPAGRTVPWPDGRLRPWIEWFGAGRLIAGAVTMVVLVVVGWWLLRAPVPPTEAGLPLATAPPGPTSTPPTATTGPPRPILVHVAGAVAVPGVYELAADARVETAIDAAGGAMPTADPGALNLAAVVADGERVYVPVVGEAPPPAPSSGGVAEGPAGPIDLNRASVEELDELPGIGPATATAIVEHRTEHGPFASVDDLEAVRGIGPAKLEGLRDLVRV
ncbi:hypothetical protein BH18ACT2_BH18ACT2_12880 [soil metagenome]